MIHTLNPTVQKLVGTYTTPNPSHRHAKWELAVFEKGHTLNCINGEEFSASAGDVFLIGPPHLHAIKPLTPTHLHQDLYLEQSDLEKILDCYPEIFKKSVISGKLLIKLKLDIQHQNSVIKSLQTLESLCLIESIENGSPNFQSLKTLASSILNYVISIYVSNEKIQQSVYPEWFHLLINKLNSPEYFTKKVNEIISESNYSHTQFSKLFKKFCKLPLVEYMKNLRLNYAWDLLKNTDHSTLFICEQCGYDSYSYFERTFKSKFGCTPSQHRKKQLPPPREKINRKKSRANSSST